MPIPEDYLTRVYAGVLGKLIGVYLGRPFEGWSHERIMAELGPVQYYVNERLGVPLVVTDDDVGGTFTFVRALADNDFPASLDAGRIGDTWLNYIVEKQAILWWGGIGNSTEHTAYLRLKHGVRAPLSGAAATNGQTVAEQIGAQIFIDGWALVSPGNPAQAARLARAAAQVSHDGVAVDAAVLIAAMEAQAFVDSDLDRLLDVGLSFVPRDGLIAKLVADVRAWHATNPDWLKTRALIEQRYGYQLYPGNCHVIPNHAVVIMALLYGADDFQRSMVVANTAGWDTDCNAGNVGCLMGIRLGLAGIEAGPDWRGPVADRLFLCTADGGSAVTDAVRVSVDLVEAGRRLAEQPTLPAAKGGARFHFSLPGSVQGFMTERGPGRVADFRVENVGNLDGGALALRFRGLAPGLAARAATATFTPPDAERMRTYDFLASPTLNPGQTVRARLFADPGSTGPVTAALYLRHYGADDALVRVAGPAQLLAPGDARDIAWTLGDVGGWPIAEVGVALTAADGRVDGVVLLDWLTWDGVPAVVLRRPEGRGEFWRRAWVNGTTFFSKHFPSAFHLSQDEGRGLLIYGTRDWRDYTVKSSLTVLLGQGGVAVRVQGLRRFVALMLAPSGLLQLVKVRDEEVTVLAETPFAWAYDKPVALTLTARGTRLRGSADGAAVLEATDTESPLRDGGIALVLIEGAIATDRVEVGPASEFESP